MIHEMNRTYQLSPEQHNTLMLRNHNLDPWVAQVQCRFSGDLDQAHFERAWQHVINTHPALRTSIFLEAIPQQIINDTVPVRITYNDWRSLPHSAYTCQFGALCSNEASMFDENTTSVQVAVCQCADDTYDLVWSLHPMLLDAQSARVVMEDAFAYYEIFCQGYEPLLQCDTRYEAYIRDAQERETERMSFQRTPYNSSKPSLHYSNSTVANKSDHRMHTLSLAPHVVAQLKNLVQQHEVTSHSVLCAAWALVVADDMKCADILFGIETTNLRKHTPGDIGIGRFTSVLPLHLHASRDFTALQWVHQVHTCMTNANRSTHLRLDCGEQADASAPQSILFNSVVGDLLEDADTPDMWEGALTLHSFTWCQPSSALLTIRFAAEQHLLMFEYDATRLSPQRVEVLARQAHQILAGFANQPTSQLSALLRCSTNVCWFSDATLLSHESVFTSR